MKINYNIPALKVVNILNKANEAQSRSMERLSSGLQISSSKDDPAGMAISLKMRAQLDSLAQASRNSSDAISLIQTAESSLSSAHEITKRIRIVRGQEYPNFHLDTVNMGTSYDPMVLTAKNSGIAGDYLAGYDGGFVDLKLSVQTGSEANQLTQIDIASSKPDTLGLTSKTPIYGFTDYLILNDDPLTAANENRYGISLLTMEDSQFALGAVDRAIAEISSRRAYLGATQNRLEYTVKNISNNSVNLDGARSRIQDTDMAKEMVLFTKDGILSQAANAMLAQANQRPQQVFQLLQS